MPLTVKEAIAKAAKYCSYQERSQKEVREKLFDYGLYPDEVEEVLSALILEGFINEERFAQSFVRGKFRLKHWGRNKIAQALSHHNISDYCIKMGLKEIDEDDYLCTLNNLIERKLQLLSDKDPFILKNKIARFVIGKGYEPDLVWDLLRQLHV